MKITLREIRALVRKKDPAHVKTFDTSVTRAREVILIGSVSQGVLGQESDLDILFVGSGERLKTRNLDFLWVSQRHLQSQSWLGSELASHAASYGIWLKGKGQWKTRVAISQAAVAQKCERILIRVIRIYLKRATLSPNSVVRLLTRCVLDMHRAVLLADRKPIPPTNILIEDFLKVRAKVYQRVSEDDLLGELGKYLLRSFIPRTEIEAELRQRSNHGLKIGNVRRPVRSGKRQSFLDARAKPSR
jgi:hypothetical protein